MSIKNKIIFFFILIINCLILNFSVIAEELDITASEITIDKEKQFVTAKGSVVIIDSEGNKLKAERAEYDKVKNQVRTYQDSKLILNSGYIINPLNAREQIESAVAYELGTAMFGGLGSCAERTPV